jgi:hypothetical protein
MFSRRRHGDGKHHYRIQLSPLTETICPAHTISTPQKSGVHSTPYLLKVILQYKPTALRTTEPLSYPTKQYIIANDESKRNYKCY